MLCSVVTEAVKEVAKIPVWTKLTPATQDIVVEAAACFRGGADAIVSSNTFPSLPVIDPETLEFEINVDGLVSSGGLGGPAILPMSLANMARMCQGVSRSRVLRRSAAYQTSLRRCRTSCSAPARCRCARRRCSIRPSGRTSSSG